MPTVVGGEDFAGGQDIQYYHNLDNTDDTQTVAVDTAGYQSGPYTAYVRYNEATGEWDWSTAPFVDKPKEAEIIWEV